MPNPCSAIPKGGPLGRSTAGRAAGFTMIEVVIALLIAVLLAALVAPLAGRLPAKLVIRQATDDLEKPFWTAARRARATGRTVQLSLTLEQGSAEIVDLSAAAHSLPPIADDDSQSRPPADELSFRLPAAVDWEQPLPSEPVRYTFLPNGQADGPALRFEIRKRAFSLAVDQLTGRPLVSQIGE